MNDKQTIIEMQAGPDGAYEAKSVMVVKKQRHHRPAKKQQPRPVQKQKNEIPVQELRPPSVVEDFLEGMDKFMDFADNIGRRFGL